MKILDIKTETQVVAMLARGDTYEGIRGVLAADGINITIGTISAVRKRNKEALEYIKGTLVEHETRKSTQLLAKAHNLIERKLNRALRQDDIIAEYHEQYQKEEIDEHQLDVLVKIALKNELTVPELTSLAKEMFTQSQVEQGKPTAISENPTQARENLKRLLEAIHNKDDKGVLDAIFLKEADNA